VALAIGPAQFGAVRIGLRFGYTYQKFQWYLVVRYGSDAVSRIYLSWIRLGHDRKR